MKITESKLRNIIRSVIKESMEDFSQTHTDNDWNKLYNLYLAVCMGIGGAGDCDKYEFHKAVLSNKDKLNLSRIYSDKELNSMTNSFQDKYEIDYMPQEEYDESYWER